MASVPPPVRVSSASLTTEGYPENQDGGGSFDPSRPRLAMSRVTPKTCENFIKLCKKNYYDGTIFHRSIRNFVIQGGDPTGTGTGGESCWGKPFRDEIKPNLSHTGRGVLSMANTGPNTNKSQFFITFRSCTYLDKKHTVFGRVVGGFDTLTAMEKVDTDSKTDRPKEDIRIESTVVFVDPYEEADTQVALEREKALKEEEEQKMKERPVVPKKEQTQEPKTYRTGVGKSEVIVKRHLILLKPPEYLCEDVLPNWSSPQGFHITEKTECLIVTIAPIHEIRHHTSVFLIPMIPPNASHNHGVIRKFLKDGNHVCIKLKMCNNVTYYH
ncbi:unnamed protein product [Ranitomeya imitator]|uniref:PPIase cyclophilin-type domain-containing protein n=1 Tax=Ranitomeya imitator TaxID=111125 RepID=A0ABN9MHJ6_9NEOB|nr:unnamed protein product [Ranitomeya imitator]